MAGWDGDFSVLIRLLPDGGLDPTFAPSPPGLLKLLPAQAWRHTDGAFLIANGSKLLRFDQNGALDTNFQAPDGTGAGYSASVVILPDGKIITPLVGSDGTPTVVRLR